MPQQFQDPKDAKRQQAAGKGHIKSLTASARFCTKPVSLKQRPPWDDDKKESGK